jgi:pimeloyl-ACP methyl ester carboxylesterase
VSHANGVGDLVSVYCVTEGVLAVLPGIDQYRWLLAILILVFALAALLPRAAGARASARFIRRIVLFFALSWVCLIFVWDIWGGSPAPIAVETLRNRNSDKSTIVFIHGWQGAPDSWRTFSSLLLGDPRFREYGIALVRFPTRIVAGNLSIDNISEELARSLVKDVPNGAIDIVAHSLGGVIARTVLVKERASIKDRVTRLITLGSPFGGTNPAGLAPELGLDAAILDDLAPGSAFLARLAARWEALLQSGPGTLRDLCISSRRDAVVAPDSATKSCSTRSSLDRWGHVELTDPTSRDDERYAIPTSFLIERRPPLESH